MVERAIDLSEHLPPPLQEAQVRAILAVISEQMLAQLQTMAMNLEKIPESPGVKRLRRLLEKQGHILGKAEGKAEGRAEGKQLGKAEGKQEALLAVLDARGLSVTARQRARILKCSDLEVLGGWITRAVSVASTRDLLGSEEATSAARTRASVASKRAPKRRAAAAK